MHSDERTVLEDNEFALVTNMESGTIELLVPQEENIKGDITREALYLTACFARFDDDDFVEEMIDWFKSQEQ